MDAKRDDRSLGQLFGDLSRQLSTLVRQEIDLARTEMTSKATSAGRDVGLIAAGGAAAYAAFLALMVAVALVLVEAGVAPWLAWLLVALIVGAAAAFLILRGRQQLQQMDVAPRRTVETLKDDAEWAKERMK